MSTEIELLKEIAANTAGDTTTTIAIITAVSVLLASGVSAAFGYFGIRRTLIEQSRHELRRLRMERKRLMLDHKAMRAGIVTTERLRWLQDIRSKIADFFAKIEMQMSHLERPTMQSDVAAKQAELDQFALDANRLSSAIQLMLDPSKDDQRRLSDAIGESLGVALGQFQRSTSRGITVPKAELAKHKYAAFDAAREIGNKAWGKIQRVE